MTLSPFAGQPAPAELLIDVDRLVNEYYTRLPDTSNPQQLVHFGTSGHRGTPEEGTFTEAHILAISQAICDYRAGKRISGPLFMGKDTHAVSGPAQRAAIEVLAANGVETMIQSDDGFTPTPVVSHAILCYNRGRKEGLADGIVITPSHNPPRDGGFKYNPPHGGPADTHVTHWIEERANSLLRTGNREVKRMPYESARKAATTHSHDFMMPYVKDLANVIDIDCIRSAGIRMGVDPLGGASVHYWEPIKDLYGLDITLVNAKVDPRFSFMTVDHDGKIRMDCSSPYAMAEPGRTERPVRNRLWKRHRCGPAWHRDPFDGTDESQPLPGRGHPLPSYPPARMAEDSSRRQDPRQQCPDRPGRRGPWPQTVRSAGRI